MKYPLKIAVIGGTGKSGKYLIEQLLDRNFSLKLLIRNPSQFSCRSPLVEIISGDVRDYAAVATLLKGCRAVVSTLGQPRGEAPVFSQATRHVLRAMQEHGIQRYILTTGLNVDAPSDQKSSWTRAATDWMKANYPDTTADKQREYELLAKSDANWTLLRLPLIELTDTKNEVTVSLEDCPGEKVSATSLAYFLVGQLSDEQYRRKAPFVANG